MGLSIGIVGLPNVGKSTLFTALTKKGALAANYPFATIEPNVGMVPVPDARLDAIADIYKPEKLTHAMVEFVDIAGLVEGASEGEGLGNQFLGNIRETDAICEVVRYFSDPDVIHVGGAPDPASDVETIRTELVLADLGTVERAIPRLEKDAKRDDEAEKTLAVARRVYDWMAEGHRARRMEMSDQERVAIRELQLLTMKPMLYIANIDESEIGAEIPAIDGQPVIPICAKIEADMTELEAEELAEYLEMEGLEEPGLNALIRQAYELLGLQSYFTGGPKEVRAWTIPIGATAPEAAGEIHTDFQRGFIKAEICRWDELVDAGDEAGVKSAGKMRLEGKEYVVEDGDVIHFKFNV